MSLEYDCCGSIDKKFKLNEERLHIPLKSVADSLDFRIVSHKAEDVEKLLLEQEWKIKYSTSHLHLYFFVLCWHGDDWFNFVYAIIDIKTLPQTMPEVLKMVEG